MFTPASEADVAVSVEGEVAAVEKRNANRRGPNRRRPRNPNYKKPNTDGTAEGNSAPVEQGTESVQTHSTFETSSAPTPVVSYSEPVVHNVELVKPDNSSAE